jgi:hypothetical protein
MKVSIEMISAITTTVTMTTPVHTMPVETPETITS